MAELIEFTGNYNDLSTQQGFQWEFFFCTECGTALEVNAKFCPECGARQG